MGINIMKNMKNKKIKKNKIIFLTVTFGMIFGIMTVGFTAGIRYAAVNSQQNLRNQMEPTSIATPDIKSEKVAYVEISPNNIFDKAKDLLIAEKVNKNDAYDFELDNKFFKLVNFNELMHIQNMNSKITSTAATAARLYFVKTSVRGVPVQVESAHQFKFRNLDMKTDMVTTDDGKTYPVSETRYWVPVRKAM